MPSSRRGGGVSKRCECRGPDGKLLGTACPLLAKKNHGAPFVRQELPLDAEGQRRQFRRTGSAGVKEAQTDLDRVRAILDLAGDDEDAGHRIGDLLQTVMKKRTDIPEPGEVKRKLGVGVPLDGAMTVGDWLDTWRASKKTRDTTNAGYDSHIRVHLKPHLAHHRLDRLGVAPVQTMFDAIDDQNEVIAAENLARREQQARCRRTRPGVPRAFERQRIAEQITAEKAKLADMKPYRRITGPATKQRIRATLRAALNAAIARQLITFNAAEHVELASGRRPKPILWTAAHTARWRQTGEKPSAVMVWTPIQIGAFLDAAQDHRLYAFYHLIAFRGLRRGEGVGQDWAGVDLDGGLLTIAREIVVGADGWTPVETDPKTDGSAATIALDTATGQVLQEHRERQEAERAAWDSEAKRKRAAGEDAPLWTDTGKVFVQEDGSWLHPDTVSKEFRRIYEAAGLPPINLRDLRHCAATLIHAGGGDLHAIKETLRHSTIVLASDTYTSLLPEVDREIAEKAAAVVPRARKSRAVEPLQ